MTLFAWISLGLIAGLATRLWFVPGGAVRLIDCVLLGSLGALLGGSLFGLLGSNVAFGLSGAAAGAIAILAVCARVRRRGARPHPPAGMTREVAPHLRTQSD